MCFMQLHICIIMHPVKNILRIVICCKNIYIVYICILYIYIYMYVYGCACVDSCAYNSFTRDVRFRVFDLSPCWYPFGCSELRSGWRPWQKFRIRHQPKSANHFDWKQSPKKRTREISTKNCGVLWAEGVQTLWTMGTHSWVCTEAAVKPCILTLLFNVMNWLHCTYYSNLICICLYQCVCIHIYIYIYTP